MSSKSADPSAKPLLGWKTSWSITARLTLLYTLSAFTLVAIAGVVLYWGLTKGLENEDRQFLSGRIHELRRVISARGHDIGALQQEVEWEGAEGQDASFRFYSRIAEADGTVLAETSGMTKVAPASAFPISLENEISAGRAMERRIAGGQVYLLASVSAEQHPQREGRQIQVALDTSRDAALLARYRRELLMVLLVGLVASAALGNIVARRGMRPLADITRAAMHISASRLHERIDPEDWPKELSMLAIAFDAMLARLQDSFVRLSQFSADLAHELRTPINNLMGETEVALARSRTAEEYRQVLESSHEEQARLARMVDSLLLLARADSAAEAIDRKTLPARKEIQAVCDFYFAAAEEQGIQLGCLGEGTVFADSVLLRRVLSNLLANALRHAISATQIRVSIDQSSAGTTTIVVKDNGAGIASEHLPHVFTRFYGTRPADSKEPRGAGLGLPIVKAIMTLHQGNACVQSERGEGTSVVLTFPASA
jgi:two-component system, OmpR family, heavy metal sensor histidine kinase CusS